MSEDDSNVISLNGAEPPCETVGIGQRPAQIERGGPKDLYVSLTNQAGGDTLLTISTPQRQLMCIALSEVELMNFYEETTEAIMRLVRKKLRSDG